MNNKSKKSFKEKFVVDSGYIFTSTILVNLFLSINSMIITRILGPENLGIFSILQFLGGIIVIFASFILYSAATKFIAEYRAIDKIIIGRIIGNISLLLLILSIFVLFVTFVFSDFLSRFYNEPSINFLLKMYLVVIFFTVFSNFGIFTLAGFQKMQLISKLKVVLALIGVPITLVLVYFFSISGVIFALIINTSILTLVSSIFILNLLKKEEIKINFSMDIKLITEIMRYSFPLFISNLSYGMFMWFGSTYLLIKGDFTDVGYYKIALILYGFVLFIPEAINYNLIPTVSNLFVSKPKQLPLFISKVLKIIMFAVLPIVLWTTLFSRELILFLFGNAYEGAVSVTYILIISSFFFSIIIATHAVFKGIGKTKTEMYLNIISYSLFIILAYFLISEYGLIGIGYAYLLTYLFGATLCSFSLNKYIKLQYKQLTLPFIICVIFLIFSYLVMELLSGLLFYAAGILLILMVLLIEWKLLEKEDKDMILTIGVKLRKKLFTI